MNDALQIPDHHLFHHDAMMTTFYLRLCEKDGQDESFLASLACECVQKIDELERKLSRYHDGGDISRINAMQAGETLYISEECHECLLVAMEACVRTGGLFDPTLGAMIEHRKSGAVGDFPENRGQLMVSPDSPMVYCESPGKIIDLGGIGKGFALDQIAEILRGWEVRGALVSSGASTHLALGELAWPIDLEMEGEGQTIALKNEALSSSGTEMQGDHIVHPQEWKSDVSSRKNSEECCLLSTWAISDSAALADAWSTALMLMTREEIKQLSATLPSEEKMLNRVCEPLLD